MNEKATRCPDCGTQLSEEAWALGLCVPCLASLAVEAPSLHAELLESEEGSTLARIDDALAPGEVLGERYRVRSLLGRGGMGAVWRAFDLKLRVDVALKALRPERLSDERGRRVLRNEVRSARQVMSPNVCRVFDLVEVDGRELVSMEYVDGQTLVELMRSRGALPLEEAREIASQFLAGLDAIHEAGLVHRDFKPENVMLTRAGRVVVMDFGIARALAGGAGETIAGTLAYMAPEQARGDAVDARADVFSAGVVLAEMIGGEGTEAHDTRSIWRGVRQSPPQLPESPWKAVLTRAVAATPEERYGSASALARALEEITLHVEGDEALNPYPGLASFATENAAYFFGREREVEAMWRNLRHPRLVALIGPSGAGKSSFLRAGLLAMMPEGFRAVLATPGSRPALNLGRALADELANDTDAMRDLLLFEDPEVAVSLVSRWRERHEHTLIIIDQFEELFTLNRPDVQGSFAAFLGRLPLEADTHVLLSMRDDFLFHCQAHPALQPIFSELTPLGPLTRSGLRRALVQPALKCGYRFEDDGLVDDLVNEVHEERGALPLLAFSAARLWELRDLERGLLTREAYEHIGGVGGALAQHAEATLETIGHERVPIVRELFRNLVTAEGTRAARERGELLSVFTEEREAAASVLRSLVDSRLLTTYELPGDDEDSKKRQRLEIIHESLLKHWPRLVRWQVQEADNALLRDQLRQAAQLWEERGRPDDLLWTETSYREYALWRERYQGGLTTSEEAFARAMTARALRRRKRRRVAVSFVIAFLLVVVAMVGWSRQEALRAARTAEAAELLSVGRLRLEGHPTAALAHALASLERADNEPARRFAVEALWKGPMVTVIPDPHGLKPFVPLWSPDGRWLAMGGNGGIVAYDGERNEFVALDTETTTEPVAFTSDGSRLVTNPVGFRLDLWSLAKPERIRRWPPGPGWVDTAIFGERLVTIEPEAPDGPLFVRERSLESGDERSLGLWRGGSVLAFGPRGEWIASVEEGRLIRRNVASLDGPARVLGQHDGDVRVRVNPRTGAIVTADADGLVRLWDAESGPMPRELESPVDARRFVLDPAGRFIVTAPARHVVMTSGTFYAFDLEAPRGASPIPLLNDELSVLNALDSHPTKPILASGNYPKGVLLWNLGTPRAIVLRAQRGPETSVAFAPDGRLVSASEEGVVRLWSLWADPDAEMRELRSRPGVERLGMQLSVSSDGSFVLVSDLRTSRTIVLPLDGSPSVVHPLERGTKFFSLSPDGRRVALTHGGLGQPEAASLRLLDLQTGDVRSLYPEPNDTRDACVFNSPGLGAMQFTFFLPNGRMITEGALGLRLWDLGEGTSRQLRPCREMTEPPGFGATPDSRWVLVLDNGSAAPDAPEAFSFTAFDLETKTTRPITWHGNQVSSFALDPTGEILVTGSADGVVRVGKLWGGEPHLLYGHSQKVTSVAVSPDGKWIASGSNDDTIRLWNMPHVTKPPLHTLPYEELLARLREFTNLRVVVDEDSVTGFAVAPGPFHGWNNLPQSW